MHAGRACALRSSACRYLRPSPPHAGLRRLILDDAGGKAAFMMLRALDLTKSRLTLQHISFVPRHGAPADHWTTRARSAAFVIGRLPEFQNLQSVVLPLPCGILDNAWIAEVLLYVPKCAAVTLVKPSCVCDTCGHPDSKPDACARALWQQLSLGEPVPHVRELELVAMRFDRGCNKETERWLGKALESFGGVTALRLQTALTHTEDAPGPDSHQMLAVAAVPKMPQLQSIEVVCVQGAEETRAMVFPLPQAAGAALPGGAAEGAEEDERAEKRERGCDGCGCEMQAGPGECPRKWRRRTT